MSEADTGDTPTPAPEAPAADPISDESLLASAQAAAAEAVKAATHELDLPEETALEEDVLAPDEVVVDEAPEEADALDEPPADEPAPEPEPAQPDEALLLAEKEARELKVKLGEAESFKDRLKDLFAVDPKAALAELGIEATLETAEDVYNATLGDDAPDEWKTQRDRKRLELDRKALEREKEAKKAAETEQSVEEYFQGLQKAVQTLDEVQHPVIAELVNRKGDAWVQDRLQSSARAFATQFNVAPTAEELFEVLTKHYDGIVTVPQDTTGTQNEEPTKTPSESKKPRVKQKKSLRNELSQSRAPSKPVEDMTDEEYDKYLLRKARSKSQAVIEREKTLSGEI